jgi:ABC-type nickel/cobalt efflux system permease component RcnA
MILLDIRFSETGAAVAELAVALMLVILGIRLFIRLRRGATLHVHRHSHRGIEHVHPHLHQHREHPQHEHRPAEAGSHDSHTGKALAPAHTGAVKGSLFVGSLHGLAGSSALTLLILGTIQSEVAAIAYLMLFSIGSTAGMTLASWIFGRKLQQVFTGPRFGTRLAAASAAVSVGLGMMIAWEEAPRVFSALGG